MARELVNSKIEMRREIDAMEDSKDSFEKELEGTSFVGIIIELMIPLIFNPFNPVEFSGRKMYVDMTEVLTPS